MYGIWEGLHSESVREPQVDLHHVHIQAELIALAVIMAGSSSLSHHQGDRQKSCGRTPNHLWLIKMMYEVPST
jgi:hypothetical protein